jgi:Family of unknown function (DUF6221)
VPTTLAAPATSELIRFLLARVDEDDAALKKRARALPADDTAGLGSLARLRAESAARRRVIGTVQQLLVLRDQPSEKPVRDGATQILRDLAGPYTDHVGFRSEWDSRH